MGEIMRRRSTYETGTGIHGSEHLSTLPFEFLLDVLSPVTNRMGGVTSSRSGTGQKVGFRPTLEKCLEKLVCDNHRQTSACAGCPRTWALIFQRNLIRPSLFAGVNGCISL